MSYLKSMFLVTLSVLMTSCAQVLVTADGKKQSFTIDTNLIANKKAPTILIAHGCSGANITSFKEWAKEINQWGYHAIIVDSYTARGKSNICNTGGISPETRAVDLIETAKWVKSQQWHSGKVGAIGFSHGGSSVLSVANLSYLKSNAFLSETASQEISAVVSYYPNCTLSDAGEKPDIPVLLLLGGKDSWTPISMCNLDRKTDKNYEIMIYLNAGHSFDLNLPPRNYMGHYLFYDKEADKASRQLTRDFFTNKLDSNF